MGPRDSPQPCRKDGVIYTLVELGPLWVQRTHHSGLRFRQALAWHSSTWVLGTHHFAVPPSPSPVLIQLFAARHAMGPRDSPQPCWNGETIYIPVELGALWVLGTRQSGLRFRRALAWHTSTWVLGTLHFVVPPSPSSDFFQLLVARHAMGPRDSPQPC